MKRSIFLTIIFGSCLLASARSVKFKVDDDEKVGPKGEILFEYTSPKGEPRTLKLSAGEQQTKKVTNKADSPICVYGAVDEIEVDPAGSTILTLFSPTKK